MSQKKIALIAVEDIPLSRETYQAIEREANRRGTSVSDVIGDLLDYMYYHYLHTEELKEGISTKEENK